MDDERLLNVGVELQIDPMIATWSTSYAIDRAIDLIVKLDKHIANLPKCCVLTDKHRGVKLVWDDIRYEIAAKAGQKDHIFMEKDGIFVYTPNFDFVMECFNNRR